MRLVLGEFLGQNIVPCDFLLHSFGKRFYQKTDIMGLWAGYFCILINIPELCSGM